MNAMISRTIADHPALEHLTTDQFLDFYWNESVCGASLVTMENKWLCPNPRLCALLGYPPSRLEEMTWMAVTIEPDRKEDLDAVAAVIRGELPSYVMDKTYATRSGTRILARLTVKPIRDPEHKVAVFLSQIQEIDGNPVHAPDELRVMYEFIANRKKFFALAFFVYTVAIALAGEGAITWLRDVFAVASGGTP